MTTNTGWDLLYGDPPADRTETVITGSSGNAGKFLMGLYPDAIGVEAGQALELSRANTLIHCAINYGLGWRGCLDLNLDAIEAATKGGCQRIIFASSPWAQPNLYGLGPFNGGSAMKRATEAWLEAWVAEGHGKAAICLRLGSFGHGNDPELRVTESGLRYWFNRAMNAPAGFHVWSAMGEGS